MKKRLLDGDGVPELGNAFFSNAKRIDDGPAALSAAIRQEFSRRRGQQKTPTKKLVSLRLQRTTIEAYRHTGPGWQARIDADLAEAAERRKRPSGDVDLSTPAVIDLMEALQRSLDQVMRRSTARRLVQPAPRRTRSA
jgi:uncharacterized protein (DUF4415 family)